jgi:hypothetical protein
MRIMPRIQNRSVPQRETLPSAAIEEITAGKHVAAKQRLVAEAGGTSRIQRSGTVSEAPEAPQGCTTTMPAW